MAGWPASVCVMMNPVFGRDVHDMIIPPAPAPIPGPYVWVQTLSGIFWPTVKMAPTVFSGSFPVIQRGSDIGSFVVHIGNPANINLPFIILGSASKSEFGSLSVKAENKPLATTFPLFILGVNLTCQGPALGPAGPFPLPLGAVLGFGTQFAGMSLGDVIACLVITIADMVIQAIINKLGSALGTGIANKFFKVSGTIVVDVLRNNTVIGNAVSLILGDFVTGSPLGYSSTDIPGTSLRTPLSAFLGDKEDEFFELVAAPTVDESELPPLHPEQQDAGTPSNAQQTGNSTSDAGSPDPADPNAGNTPADKSSGGSQGANQNNNSSNSDEKKNNSSGDENKNSSSSNETNSSQTSNSPVNNYCGDVETL